MKANAAIQILPNMATDQETVRVVDAVIDYIRSTGLSYYVGPSETSIEGDSLEELISVIQRCVETATRAGSDKVYAFVKLTYAPEGEVLTIEEKTAKHHH